jgi:hypothetical protein
MQDTELKDISHFLKSLSTEEKGNIAIALNKRSHISDNVLISNDDSTYRQAFIVIFIIDILQFCRFRFLGSHLDRADAIHQEKYRKILLQMGFNNDIHDPFKELPSKHMFPPHECFVEVNYAPCSTLIFRSAMCSNYWTFEHNNNGQISKICDFQYGVKITDINVIFDFVKQYGLADIISESSMKSLECKYTLKPGDGIMYSANDLFVFFFREEIVTTDSLKKIFKNRTGTEIRKDFFTSDAYQLPADFLINGIDRFRIRVGDGAEFYDPELIDEDSS